MYTYVVIAVSDVIHKNVYVGSNKREALDVFQKYDNDFIYTNVWIEIWKNGVLMNDCWEPTKEDFMTIKQIVSMAQVELNRHDIRFKEYQEGRILFEDRFHEEYYVLVTELYVEEIENLEKEQLIFEAAEEDWFVFRNKEGKVFLLYLTGENAEVFANINREVVKQYDQRIPSKWLHANIYGYCNGFFDRSHYYVDKHEIEAVGRDWIVARDVDEPHVKGRVYIAHFDEASYVFGECTMEELLEKWSQKIDM